MIFSLKKLIFLLKLKFCLQAVFIPLNTCIRKGKDPEPDPYLWLVDPDPGGPKTCGSSGSPTLAKTRWKSRSDLVADGGRAAAPLDENGRLTDDPTTSLTPRGQVVRGNLQGKRSGSHGYVHCFR